MDHLLIILIFPVPNKVPGSPLLMSLHSITNPFKPGSAVMFSVDVGHDEPMGFLLATLRYGPHVDAGGSEKPSGGGGGPSDSTGTFSNSSRTERL